MAGLADRSRWSGAVLFGAIVAVTLWVYVPTLDHGRVWDDWVNLAPDAGFRGLGWEQVKWAFTEVRLGHYQPLAWLSFSVDHAVWGEQLSGYHATNLFLHLVAVALFAAVGLEVSSRSVPPVAAHDSARRAGVAFATAIFALHPMRVESVAWLTERRHLLAAVFFLAATLVYLRGTGRGRSGRWTLTLCSILFLLSLLATPLGIGLPVVLLAADVAPLGRWRAGEGWKKLGRLALEKAPLWVLAAAFGVSALAAQDESGALIRLADYTPSQRLAQLAYGLAFYPRALFATGWYPLYERPAALDPLELRFAASAVAVVAAGGLLIVCRRRLAPVAAAAIAYLALIAPVSGLAQSGSQLVADRYGYLATAPCLLLVGAAVTWGWRRLTPSIARAVLGLTLASAVGLSAVAARAQTRVWKDDETLWRHVLEGGPSGLASTHLGILALRRGAPAEAVGYLRAAIETTPGYGNAWRATLTLLETTAAPAEAVEMGRLVDALEAGLELHATTAIGWRVVGLARLRAGQADEAVARLERAAAIRADQSVNWRWLGIAQLEAGDAAAAAQSFESALRLEPGDRTSHAGLAAARRRADGEDG